MEPYNSLTDPHLYGYFSNEQRRKELKKAGLIGKQGEVITEATYRLNAIMAEKGMRRFNAEDDRKLDERGRRLRLLPKVNMPTEDFCREKSYKYRSASSSRYFSPLKSNSYDRIKSAPDYVAKKPTYTTYQDVMSGVRAKYPWSSSSPYLWPLPSTDVIRLNISGGDRQRCSGYLSYSALPAIRKSQDFEFYDNKGRKDEMLRLSGTLHIFPTTSFTSSSTCGGNSNSIFQRYHGTASNSSALFSTCHKSNDTFNNNNNSQPRMRCIVTMHYYGDPIRLSELWSYRKDEIIVEQQHCGGNTLVVFRGRLAPGSDFSFPSMRRKDFPFSLTIYIEHQQNTRISVCCETKHKRGVRLGGGNGCFGIVDVENPVNCESCNEAKKHKKLEKKAKKQKKTKASLLKDEGGNENEGIPQKRPRDDDGDDDGDKDKIKQAKQNQKKEKTNKLKDDDEYEDDFENESDDENKNPSSSQQKEDKKRQSNEKTPDSQRSTKSETNKIPEQNSKKKTRKSEEGEMEIEESPKSVQNKELRQSQDSASLKLAKSNPKKEADSTNSETPESNEKKRSASKDKKMLKRKSAKVIESPPILADSAKIISGKPGQIVSGSKKETPRKERDASKSNKNKNFGKPLETADDPMKNDSSIRGGRRLLSTEETPRMSQISETEKMNVDDKNDPDRNKENETRTEKSRGNNVKSESESSKLSSATDRKKKNEKEYERKLREVAKDCVEQIYRSLEEAMKNEDDW